MKPRDRSELNKKLTIENFFPPFFSVLLPELGRPEYLKSCIKHLMHYADMPFETIVHDDGSGSGKQKKLLEEVGGNASILILNTGRNIGLATSMQRCRKMASSRYLLKMDTDIYITSGVMKNIKQALDLPYCGIVNLERSIPGKRGDKGLYIAPNGTKIKLQTSPSITSLIFGCRSDVWDDAGGWDENVQSTASDVGFLGNIFGMGQFSLSVEGTFLNESYLTDDGIISNSVANPDYVSSARFSAGEFSAPTIHKFDPVAHRELSRRRSEAIWHGVNDTRLECMKTGEIDNSWYSSTFYSQEASKLFPSTNVIDWNYAREHGHDKWKEQIIRDFNLEKE